MGKKKGYEVSQVETNQVVDDIDTGTVTFTPQDYDAIVNSNHKNQSAGEQSAREKSVSVSMQSDLNADKEMKSSLLELADKPETKVIVNPRDNQQLIDEPTIIVKSNLNEIKDKKGQLKQPSETKSVGKSETKVNFEEIEAGSCKESKTPKTKHRANFLKSKKVKYAIIAVAILCIFILISVMLPGRKVVKTEKKGPKVTVNIISITDINGTIIYEQSSQNKPKNQRPLNNPKNHLFTTQPTVVARKQSLDFTPGELPISTSATSTDYFSSEDTSITDLISNTTSSNFSISSTLVEVDGSTVSLTEDSTPITPKKSTETLGTLPDGLTVNSEAISITTAGDLDLTESSTVETTTGDDYW